VPSEDYGDISARTWGAGAGRLPAPLLEGGQQPSGARATSADMERLLLLVEHDRFFGEGLALLLEWRTGLGCVLAGTLAEASIVLDGAKRKPACVVVDLDLPEGGPKYSRNWTGCRCWC